MDNVFYKHVKCWANSEMEQKKSGLMHSVVLLTDPEWSVVRIEKERIFSFVQYKDTVMVLQSIQPYFLWKRYRWVGKHTFSTRAALPTINQPRTMVYGQEDQVWKARDKFVSSHFCVREIRHRDSGRSIRTRPVHEPSIVVNKQSYRFKYQRPGGTWRKIPQGIAEEVKKQAERRTNSRFTMYVPGIHKFSTEEYSKKSTLWKLCRITKTQKSKILIGFLEEAQLRNDRGALPRGRAISNAHARTRIHAIRHGWIWQNRKWQEESRRAFERKSSLQKLLQTRAQTTTP